MPKKLFLVLFLLLSLAWIACKKVDIQFGDQFLDNGYTQIVKVDSFQTDVSTIYIDSFATSSKGVTMVGGYPDPVFGKITTNCYFEVVPPAYSDTFADSFRATTFDSLAIVIKPDHSYAGDTSKPLQIIVNRVAEPIAPYDNSTLIINNNRSFAVTSPSIGSKTIAFRPSSNDSIIVRLDDNLGQALLKKFQDPNDLDIRSSDGFLQYFYGLRISSGANSQLIFGAKDSVIMRLYYKKPSLYLESKTLEFTLANKNHHFNNITVDRSGTVLKDIATVKQINSKDLGNTAYSMYAAGVMTKIRFPSARDILKLPNYAKLLKATLIIRPVRGSYSASVYGLPPLLRLSSTTILNQIGPDLSFTNSSGNAATQTGDLVVDYLFGENTSYQYDVTTLFKTLITDGTINANGVLAIPPSPALETQFGRLVVGNYANSAGKMELQIIYASVQ